MWIRIPGKNRTLLIPAAILTLAVLTGVPALAKDRGGPEAPAPAPAPAITTPEPEISFNGKVFCSLKRVVDLPFKAVITSVLVRSGERVAPGQALAKFRPVPEALLLIQQRLSPLQISDTEVKLAELERNLDAADAKQQELAKLAVKKLASPQSLEQANHDLQQLTRERTELQTSLRQLRLSAQDDLAVLKSQLGNGVKSGAIPQEGILRAPIGGYIIWIQPELRQGALLEPTPGVFQVGVMNPMLVRAQAFEIEALQIKTGETAEINLESLPGRKFQGQVSRISWSSLTPGLEQPAYYDVELEVANPEMELKDGLKAQIIFRKTQ
ncbi:MAG: efflux RND transporter periplasmic adaptor subunit [Desulfobaccales bacterium]|jgi:multidrug efflux pump subunit AcrA (membrane-fusion protein)